MQDAVQRLKKGKDGLKAHLALQDKYCRNIAELTGKWKIRPNVNFETWGSAAPFIVNLAIPGADVSSEAVTQIEPEQHWRCGGEFPICGLKTQSYTMQFFAMAMLCIWPWPYAMDQLRTCLPEEIFPGSHGEPGRRQSKFL